MSTTDLPKYEKLIYHIINKFNYKYKKELYNELYIQLYQLLEKYEPSKGQFHNFAYKRLYYHCITYINSNKITHPSLDDTLYVDGEEILLGDTIRDEYSNLDDLYTLTDYLEKDLERGTPEEQFIRKSYKDGMKIKNIIKVYKHYHHYSSEKSIRKIINK